VWPFRRKPATPVEDESHTLIEEIGALSTRLTEKADQFDLAVERFHRSRDRASRLNQVREAS
jgi:hypothetical protein